MGFVRIILLVALCVASTWSVAGINPGPDFTMNVPKGGALAGDKPRIFITADPFDFEQPDEFDDLQSLIETMLLADVLDIEGMAVRTTRPVLRIIDAYEEDLANLQTYSNSYPSADYLRSITVDDGDEGVNLLIQAALKTSNRPLYVLSWGLPDTLANALKVHPEIAEKIRIIMIGDSNISVGWEPRESFSYIYNLRHKLWWVLMDNSFMGAHVEPVGMRASDPVEENFSKYDFPAAHAKDHGALGNLFYYGINWDQVGVVRNPRPHFRSGDLPSLLYLLRGNPDTPETEHWGGRFQKVNVGHGSRYNGGAENFWVDVIDENESIWRHAIENPWRENIQHDAQRTVIKYHMQFMPEIAARYDRAKYPKGANPQPLDPLKYTYASGSSNQTASPEPALEPARETAPEPAAETTPQPTAEETVPQPVAETNQPPATETAPQPAAETAPQPNPTANPQVDVNTTAMPVVEVATADDNDENVAPEPETDESTESESTETPEQPSDPIDEPIVVSTDSLQEPESLSGGIFHTLDLFLLMSIFGFSVLLRSRHGSNLRSLH